LIWGRFARFWERPSIALAAWRSTQPPPTDPLQLGEAAKRLLDDPTLQLALGRVQASFFEKWRDSALGQREAREEAYRMWWASEQLKTELRVMLGNAKAIEAQRNRAA
jgi:hypothetical protein